MKIRSNKKSINNSPVLQNMLDELTPYLQNIQIDTDNDFKPIMTFIFPINWELPELLDNTHNYGFEVIEETDTYVEIALHILNQSFNLDDLFNLIKFEIISYNKLLEEKQEELTNKIRKIQLEKEREIESLKQNLKLEIKNNKHKSNVNNNIVLKEEPKTVVLPTQNHLIKETPLSPILQQNIHEMMMQEPDEEISDEMINQNNDGIIYNEPQVLISNLTEPMIIGGVDMSQFIGTTQPIKTSELFKGL